jgi:ABC-type nitrate/sulfonate/bicarbonate transport system substrate-binding protein
MCSAAGIHRIAHALPNKVDSYEPAPSGINAATDHMTDRADHNSPAAQTNREDIMTSRGVSLLALLAAGVLAAPTLAAAEDLTVGMPTTPPNIVHMPVLIAQDLGLFKKEGVTVKTVALEDGVKVYRAMLAGNLDIGMSPGAVTLIGRSKGAQTRMILVNTPKFEASMITRDNIKTMEDLKGKRIGIQQPGGFADINSRAVLRSAKIDPKDVNFVTIATDDVPALVANQVDTAILHVDQEMFAKTKVPDLHAIARMWELQPKTLYLVDAVTEKTIKDKPAALKAYVKAHIEATRLIYTDKAKVLPIIIKHTGLPADVAEKALDYMIKECIWDANSGLGAERINFTGALMEKVGNIEAGKAPKYDDVVDTSFAKDAIKELGEWKGPICPTPAM